MQFGNSIPKLHKNKQEQKRISINYKKKPGYFPALNRLGVFSVIIIILKGIKA
jgi:hypothetical protein